MFVFLSFYHKKKMLFSDIIWYLRQSYIIRKASPSGVIIAYSSGTSEFALEFEWGSYCWIFSFQCSVVFIIFLSYCHFSFGHYIASWFTVWLPFWFLQTFRFFFCCSFVWKIGSVMNSTEILSLDVKTTIYQNTTYVFKRLIFREKYIF